MTKTIFGNHCGDKLSEENWLSFILRYILYISSFGFLYILDVTKDQNLIKCDRCNKKYHSDYLSTKNFDKWVCDDCIVDDDIPKNTIHSMCTNSYCKYRHCIYYSCNNIRYSSDDDILLCNRKICGLFYQYN